MEQKFRAVLKDRLGALGAHVKEIPGNRGTSWEVTIGGGRKWRLDPQVNLLGSKPDFVLTCDDTSVPRMAIFCDGWRYHASALHNRLADDAAKRAILRDDGLFVLEPVVGRPGGRCAASRRPWFNRAAVGPVMSAAGLDLKPAHFDLLEGTAMDLLMGWVQSPDPAGMRAIGDAVPYVLAASAQLKGSTGQRSDLLSIAGELLDGSSLAQGQGDAPAWAWRDDTLVVLSRMNPKNKSTEVVVALDDRPAAVGPDAQGCVAVLAVVQQPRGPAQHRDGHHGPEPGRHGDAAQHGSGRGAGVPGRRVPGSRSSTWPRAPSATSSSPSRRGRCRFRISRSRSTACLSGRAGPTGRSRST